MVQGRTAASSQSEDSGTTTAVANDDEHTIGSIEFLAQHAFFLPVTLRRYPRRGLF
jgi:hypothetical protein